MEINDSGVVLISTLLLLLLLTLLAINILQTGLLETRMSANYKDNILLLHRAEMNLYNQEALLQQGIISSGVTLISTDVCGVNFYRIQVNYGKEILQSTYAVIENLSNCDLKINIQSGRQSWVIL
jgi:Tfp pilus assembly protein PilX